MGSVDGFSALHLPSDVLFRIITRSCIAVYISFYFVLLRRATKKICIIQWRIQGRGPGARGPAPSLFLDQTEARRAEKIVVGDHPLLSYLKVWVRHCYLKTIYVMK